MSDYIDELVEQFVPSCRATGNDHSPGSCCECIAHESADTFARAVAERVRASAWVCSWCHGSGLHPGPYDDVPTCDRCAGRGVTFGGEA